MINYFSSVFSLTILLVTLRRYLLPEFIVTIITILGSNIDFEVVVVLL